MKHNIELLKAVNNLNAVLIGIQERMGALSFPSSRAKGFYSGLWSAEIRSSIDTVLLRHQDAILSPRVPDLSITLDLLASAVVDEQLSTALGRSLERVEAAGAPIAAKVGEGYVVRFKAGNLRVGNVTCDGEDVAVMWPVNDDADVTAVSLLGTAA